MSDEPDGAERTRSEPTQAAAPQTTSQVGVPRRLVLRHDDTGGYQILMGNRVLQGFCQEFEDITGYAIGLNEQQQVRIRIDPIGRRQPAFYPDRGDNPPDALIRHRVPGEGVRIRTTDQGIEQEEVVLSSQAHPGNPTVAMTWRDEARERLVRDIETMQNMIDLLARM